MTYQAGVTPEAGADLRLYEVGRKLRFIAHSTSEPSELASRILQPGDLVYPVARNAWPEELEVI